MAEVSKSLWFQPIQNGVLCYNTPKRKQVIELEIYFQIAHKQNLIW
uniref:Uncharacterized protein n=1 Tax=Anguilla anguilla TaxID=7936 RepID=A0A0E9WAQ2_ANGAN